jgi:hypothetical protein
VKRFALTLIAAVTALVAMSFTAPEADASTSKKLPAFEMKDLEERELRLTDDRFKGKKILVTAFGTWQQVSRDQAREIQKFHKANPDVEIIAFVVESLPEARDFVAQEGLTFPCYKCDGVTRIGSVFNRLFETKKGKSINLNRLPFAILADAERNVVWSDLGLSSSDKLTAEVKKMK